MIALKALSDSVEAETLRSIREYPSSPSKQQRSLARANENGSLVSIEESSQSLQQLLRLLGISSTDQDGTVGIDKRISAANEERAENVRNQTASLESNTLEVLTTSLQEANGTLQLLRDAMYEDSLYGGFRLADLQLGKSVNALDTELDEIGTAVKNLDLGVLHQQDNKRELFLEQWSK